jgi:hypothetical protein
MYFVTVNIARARLICEIILYRCVGFVPQVIVRKGGERNKRYAKLYSICGVKGIRYLMQRRESDPIQFAQCAYANSISYRYIS